MRLSSFRRLRFILAKIFLFGGGALVQRIRLSPLIPWKWRLRHTADHADGEHGLVWINDHTFCISPSRLRELMETLGPTFVKLGQVLSLRPDLVGQGLSRELSKLQSHVAPFSYDEVTKIIAGEFGRASDRVFASIDPVPVAAASLAQVHRAQLPDGTEVAIKVQRPEIGKVIEEDIRILRFLARLADRFISEIRPYQPRKVVEEFADWTGRELDFVVEGHNAERFRFAFRDNPYIRIPTIYWEFTTPRVLTMEFVNGVRADDLPGIDKMGLDRKDLALHGVNAQLQQFLLDGFFHGDPHPGNSFALDGNILCFYDFGIVGYLNEAQRRELLSCFVAFADKDIEGFLRHFLHLSQCGAQSNVPAFYRDGSAILAEVFFSPTSSSLAWIFFRLINSAVGRNIHVPVDLALFGKALITTEAMGKTLYPEFDFTEHLTPFVTRAFEFYLDPVRLRRSLTGDFFDWVGVLQELPVRLQNMAHAASSVSGESRPLAQDSIARRESERGACLRFAQIALVIIGLLFAVASVVALFAESMALPISYVGIAIFVMLLVLSFIKAARV